LPGHFTAQTLPLAIYLFRSRTEFDENVLGHDKATSPSPEKTFVKRSGKTACERQ
jgi:hypothetical protein